MTTATASDLAFGLGAVPRALDVTAIVVLLLATGLLVAELRSSGRRATRTMEMLQHSTLHVASVVDSAMDAIIGMDEEGRVTQFNPQAERLLGWEAEEIIGRPVSPTLVPERWRAAHERGVARLGAGGAGPGWGAASGGVAPSHPGSILGRVRELAALRHDGTEVPVDISIVEGARDGERVTYVAFLRDVTARQRAERLQGARFVVASVLGDARTLGEATEAVLAGIGTRLHCPLVVLWTQTISGLGPTLHWAAPDAAVDALERRTLSATLQPGAGLAGQVWASGRPLTLAEVEVPAADADRVGLAAAAGLGHAAAVAVSSGEKVLAVVEVFARRADELDEETIRTLDDIAGQLGQYLARRRAETLQESPERLGTLLEHAADAIVTVSDAGAILGLNDRARRMFGYGTAEVAGTDLRVLVADSHREAVIAYVKEILHLDPGTDRPRRWADLVGRRRDGSTFDLGLHLTPLSVGGRPCFLCLADEAPVRRYATDSGELRVYRGGERERHPRPA